MGFVDDALAMIGYLAAPTGQQGLPQTTADQQNPEYYGYGPGLDWGDVADVGGRLLKGLADFPFNIGEGGVLNAQQPGAERPDLGPGTNGGENGGARTSSPTVRRGMYIGGVCPGLWHTTPVRVVYDRKTGEARTVGGNRYPNRTTLAQDDSGDLQFFAPVEPTGWKLKYKTGPRRHTHRKPRHHHHRPKHHHHRPKQITAGGHRHHYTAAQLRAGFGGKARMRR